MRFGLWLAAAIAVSILLVLPADAQVDEIRWTVGSGNSSSKNWSLGTWNVRAIQLDSQNRVVGELGAGFSFYSSGNGYPVNVQLDLIGDAALSDKIRVFRKLGTILPGDSGVEYADFPCDDGLGGLLPICDAFSPSVIDGNNGTLGSDDFVGTSFVPLSLLAGVASFSSGGVGNSNPERWPAGIWNVRAVLFDGANAVGELAPGFEFNASGLNRPTDVRVSLLSRGYLGDRIRIYRKQGTLLPGDENVEFAEIACDDGTGDIAQICLPLLLQPIDLNLGHLNDSAFVGVGAVPPSVRHVGDVSLSLTGSSNNTPWNWPSGTWYIRAVVLDRERQPLSGLSTESTRSLTGSSYPTGSLTLGFDASSSDRIRIFRSHTPIQPGDTNLEYADVWCDDGSGGVLPQCLAGSAGLVLGAVKNTRFAEVADVPAEAPVAAPPSTGNLLLNPTISSYPNPAGERVNIRYAMARQGRAELRVYDLAGRLVRELSTGSADASEHEVVWDGRGNDGRRVSAGVYLIRVSTPYGEATAKALLLK